MCWLVFLGACYVAWANMVYGDKALDIPETLPDSASYLEESDNPVDIPPMFQRDKEAEATAKKADVYVRFMAKRC